MANIYIPVFMNGLMFTMENTGVLPDSIFGLDIVCMPDILKEKTIVTDMMDMGFEINEDALVHLLMPGLVSNKNGKLVATPATKTKKDSHACFEMIVEIIERHSNK